MARFHDLQEQPGLRTTDEITRESFSRGKTLETLLKKTEVIRDPAGRFERHGKELSKASKNTMNKKSQDISCQTAGGEISEATIGTGKRGPGRPPGSLNKTTRQLKEMILAALDKVGGDEYLAKLAIENSSAFASLLGKVLPTTLTASDSDGGPATITFERVIVHPDGRRHIEDKTPLQLEASHTLPMDPLHQDARNEIKDLDE